MMKAIFGNSIYLGLTRADVERMAKREPVLFNFRELKLPSCWACLALKEETIVALDNEIARLNPLVFCFCADALKEMEHTATLIRIEGRPHWLQAYTITTLVFRGEHAAEEFLRDRMDIHSSVTRRGFMPGDFPSTN